MALFCDESRLTQQGLKAAIWGADIGTCRAKRIFAWLTRIKPELHSTGHNTGSNARCWPIHLHRACDWLLLRLFPQPDRKSGHLFE